MPTVLLPLEESPAIHMMERMTPPSTRSADPLVARLTLAPLSILTSKKRRNPRR